MPRSVVECSLSVRVVIPKLGAHGNKFVGPPGDPDGMLRIVSSKPSPAPDFVLKIFVSDGEEGIRCKPKHCVVQHRPFWCVTISHRKRAVLKWYLFCRMVDCVVHIHVPRFGC